MGKAYKDMTEIEQKAYVEERKKQSKQNYLAMLEKSKAYSNKVKKFKALVKAGNDFVDEKTLAFNKGNQLKMIVTEFRPCDDIGFTGYILGIPTYWNNEIVVLRYAFSIKVPNDNFKPHISRGLCGYRIMKEDDSYGEEITVPRYVYELKQNAIERAITYNIGADILLCGNKFDIPERVIRSNYNEDKKYWNNILKTSN